MFPFSSNAAPEPSHSLLLGEVAAVEFWYDFASPYAYLSAVRIERCAEEHGMRVAWRPFLLGPIFERNKVRPSDGAKLVNMRRDVERQGRATGTDLNWPSSFPRPSLLATRVALVLARTPHVARFTRAIYRASFVEDRSIDTTGVVGDVLSGMGLVPDEWLQAAVSVENKRGLVRAVDHAFERGIFGAPTFVREDGELFWGNDRLEAAVSWVARSDAA